MLLVRPTEVGVEDEPLVGPIGVEKLKEYECPPLGLPDGLPDGYVWVAGPVGPTGEEELDCGREDVPVGPTGVVELPGYEVVDDVPVGPTGVVRLPEAVELVPEGPTGVDDGDEGIEGV